MALRFAVIQPGARMHYAVPALLERAGILHRLYTDVCASIGPLPHLESAWPVSLRPKPVRRLFGRRLPAEIPATKVRQLGVGTILAEQGLRFLAGATRRASSQQLMDMARREHFGGANAIYTVLINEDIDLCAEAKAGGLRIVHECIIGPDVGYWMTDEYDRFPEMRPAGWSIELFEEGRHRNKRKYELSDLILVPSSFTRAAVQNLCGPEQRIETVPYGIGDHWFAISPQPIVGRVLSVGSVGLLKGHHYLAAATQILERRGFRGEARVAGPWSSNRPPNGIFHGPKYLGQIPREEIAAEYARADVFVLPTLCDSFAVVQLEAMACGLPVVTTPNCGSVVRDGVDGLIVPPRNAKALADAIERIVTDRALRAEMSANAKTRAREFTWHHYGQRLLAAINNALGAPIS